MFSRFSLLCPEADVVCTSFPDSFSLECSSYAAVSVRGIDYSQARQKKQMANIKLGKERGNV